MLKEFSRHARQWRTALALGIVGAAKAVPSVASLRLAREGMERQRNPEKPDPRNALGTPTEKRL